MNDMGANKVRFPDEHQMESLCFPENSVGIYYEDLKHEFFIGRDRFIESLEAAICNKYDICGKCANKVIALLLTYMDYQDIANGFVDELCALWREEAVADKKKLEGEL